MKQITLVSLIIFSIISIAIIVAGLLSYQDKQSSAAAAGKKIISAADPALSGATSFLVLSDQEAAKHNSSGDCWLVISGKVYDVTDYLGSHPPGAGSILPFCGKDATSVFENTPHSAYAHSLLSQYYLGDLNQKIALNNSSPGNNSPQLVQGNSGNQAQTLKLPLENNPLPQTKTLSAPIPVPGISQAQAAAPISLTLKEVSRHNSKSDCWMIVNGKVYNVTTYLPYHPGGIGTILPYCGKDATAVFTGLPHSQNANNLLASYYVGNLGATIGKLPSSTPPPAQTLAPSPGPFPTPAADPATSPSPGISPTPSPTPLPTLSPSPTPSGSSYTPAQVAAHSSSGDCWMIVNGKVYNVTTYLPYHPGGIAAILPYCGKDATAAFTGLPHSQNANNLLASYYVGDLYTPPSPTPSPSPSPTPTPTPSPSPSPKPSPTPRPSPSPRPTPTDD